MEPFSSKPRRARHQEAKKKPQKKQPRPSIISQLFRNILSPNKQYKKGDWL